MKEKTKRILVILVKWRHHANGLFDPSSNSGVGVICGLSLLLVLFLAPRGFSPGTLVFPSPPKPTFPNSNSTRNQVDEKPLCGCTTSKSSFIIYFIYLSCSNHWNECSLNNAEKRRLYKADFTDVRLLVCFFLQRITGGTSNILLADRMVGHSICRVCHPCQTCFHKFHYHYHPDLWRLCFVQFCFLYFCFKPAENPYTLKEET